jgi:hypothetical protein
MLNATAKLAFFELNTIIDLYGTIFKFTPNRLQENLLSASLGIGFVPNSFLFPLFDEVVQRFNSAGISQWLISYYKNIFFEPYEEPPREPQIFSIDDLSFGFFICLAALGISIMVFASEVLLKNFFKVVYEIRNSLGLILFLMFMRKIKFKIYA